MEMTFACGKQGENRPSSHVIMSHVIGNHALRSFSLSYPKEIGDWPKDRPPPILFALGMTPTIKMYSIAYINYFL